MTGFGLSAWVRAASCLAAFAIVPGAMELSAQVSTTDGVSPADNQVVRSDVVPEGQLRGIVVDAETGKPITGAQVLIVEIQKGNLTDADGHFDIRAIEPGSHTLQAQASGYEIVRIPFQVIPPRGGWAARFTLTRRVTFGPCGWNTYGVTVVVRDALTGRAPRGRVALRISQDSLRTWAFGQASDADSSLSISAYLAPFAHGPRLRSTTPIDVEVAVLGYALWWRDDVPVQFDECSALVDADPLHVWLLPTAMQGEEANWVTNAF